MQFLDINNLVKIRQYIGDNCHSAILRGVEYTERGFPPPLPDC